MGQSKQRRWAVLLGLFSEYIGVSRSVCLVKRTKQVLDSVAEGALLFERQHLCVCLYHSLVSLALCFLEQEKEFLNSFSNGRLQPFQAVVQVGLRVVAE